MKEIDQPRLGLDGSAVYITASFGGPIYNLWAIDRNILENGSAAAKDLHQYDWQQLGAPNNDVGQYTPAHIYGSTSARDFMVEYVQNNSGSDALNIIRVSNAETGTPSFNFQSLNVGDISNSKMQGARQPGTTITINDQNGFTEEHRIENAVWQGDKLYAVVNGIRVGSGADANDVVHWFVVDTSNLNNLKLLNQGNVDVGSNFDVYYGSIAVDNAGNMIIGYSYSGPTTFASSGYAVIPNGSTGSDGNIATLTQGLGPFTQESLPGTARWGDYSGIVIDPSNDGSFWLFNQYATDDNSWATTIGGYHVPTLYTLPVTADDLMTLQQGIQAFTDLTEATSFARAIDSVPATQTVQSYADQLIVKNQPLSQVAMAVDALMFGAVDKVTEFNKLTTVFLPPQMATAIQFGFNKTVYDAEALGLGLAGGNGTSNAFATNFGNLDVSAFAQAASIAVFGTANLAGTIANFANNWSAFYTANPAAHAGLSVTLASYGAAFGDAVGLALDNPTTVGAKLFPSVSNALILNAEGLILVGTALDKQPLHKPLQGETIATTSFEGGPVGAGSDTVDLIGMTSLANHSGLFA